MTLEHIKDHMWNGLMVLVPSCLMIALAWAANILPEPMILGCFIGAPIGSHVLGPMLSHVLICNRGPRELY